MRWTFGVIAVASVAVATTALADRVGPDRPVISGVVANGALDVRAVSGAVRAASAELAACRSAKRAPTSGTVEFSVLPDGAVVGVYLHFSADRLSKPERSCLDKALGSLRFAKAAATTTVQLTLGFGTPPPRAGLGGLIGNDVGSYSGGFGYAFSTPVTVEGVRATGGLATGTIGRELSKAVVSAPSGCKISSPLTLKLKARIHRGKARNVRVVGGSYSQRTCVAKLVSSFRYSVASKATAVTAKLAFFKTTSSGTIGIGSGLRTGVGGGLGGVGGIGTGRGYGLGVRGSSSRKGPQVRMGASSTSGGLGKEVIRRVIRRSLGKFRYCYEKELVNKPSLAGTAITEFVIASDGTVASVKVAGMGNAAVEACVSTVIRGMRFPKPQGGGVVKVRYPFTFKPSGR